jgi:hypothetical protein
VSHYLVACACTQSKLKYESNYMHTCYMHTYKPSLHAIQKYKQAYTLFKSTNQAYTLFKSTIQAYTSFK